MRRLIAPAVPAFCIAALAFLSACHTLNSMENGVVGSCRIEDVDGDRAIDIGPLASTRRACAEALMLQEARVLSSLDAVASLVQTADGAIVTSGPAPARLLLRRMDDAQS